MMKKISLYFLLLPLFGSAQTYLLKPLTENTATSIRGLSVVSDSVAWVSGSNGFVGKTTNGGTSWEWIKVKGKEKVDFRDVAAFSSEEATILSAGSPAFILTTNNGGKTWIERYKNTDSAIFLDGMDFWSKARGIVFGDPIAHKMQLLTTEDGGATWQNISQNLSKKLAEGEAGFAASGTSIKTLKGGVGFVATGGTVANMYRTDDYGKSWDVYRCPILQGESSTGIFSIDFYNKQTGIAVGGNYLKDKDTTASAMLTYDGGKTWVRPVSSVTGFRSAVIYIDRATLVATGTSGSDISFDGGKHWKNISSKSFNSIQKAKHGNLILLAGEKGRVYQLILSRNEMAE